MFLKGVLEISYLVIRDTCLRGFVQEVGTAVYV